MMPRWPVRPILAAYFSLAAVIGCGADVTVATGATATGGMSGASGGTTGATATGGGGATDGGSGVSCRQCACETLMSAGGCKDICSMGAPNGTMTPNFCDGAPALSQCAACLAMTCPTADPNDPCACCLNADPNNCSCF